jgi:hypothetical protein
LEPFFKGYERRFAITLNLFYSFSKFSAYIISEKISNRRGNISPACRPENKKKSSGRVLLIYFLEVVLMFKSSAALSLVKSVESVLKTDRLAVVSCVRIS